MVGQTSLEAYQKDSSHRINQKELVFITIKAFPKGATNKMIARALNIPCSTIAGRCNDLQQEGRVKESHKDICPMTFEETKVEQRAIFWRTNDR